MVYSVEGMEICFPQAQTTTVMSLPHCVSSSNKQSPSSTLCINTGADGKCSIDLQLQGIVAVLPFGIRVSGCSFISVICEDGVVHCWSEI